MPDLLHNASMRFLVLVEGTPRPVELDFGSPKDLEVLSGWQAATWAQDQPLVRDALEFARLASKRHSQYLTTLPTATSISEFQTVIRGADAEVALLFVVRADWHAHSTVLGIAQCRRTYCHHLVLEFLAVHPSIVSQTQPRVSGIGKGLVYGIAGIAKKLGIELIWGEATAGSAPFYSHILFGAKIKDHFFIEKQTLARCAREFREKFFGDLD
jgi:hypothetical protein